MEYCPTHSTPDDRKTATLYNEYSVIKEGSEFVSSAEGVKAVLRSAFLRQDPLGLEPSKGVGPDEIPLIFLDGKLHRDRRKHITSYFAPRYIKERFEPLMRDTADLLIADLEREKQMRIDDVSWQMAVTLVGDLIGITRGMSRDEIARTAKHIDNCLNATSMRLLSGWRLKAAELRRLYDFFVFWRKELRPTLMARKSQPQEDVVSTLLREGYSKKAILADVLMLCGAGMQTTREFISLTTWHILEKPYLRKVFVEGSYEDRMGILEELLRLDPVVSTIYRRAPHDLPDKAGTEFRAGTRYAVSIRDANHDSTLVGSCPHSIDLARKQRLGDQAPAMSFGNGVHRCPGSPLALNETLFFLDRLLRVPGVRLASSPDIAWEPNVSTFEIRNLVVACD